MSEQKNIGVPANPVVTLDQTGMDEHQRNVREAYARVAQASDTGCGRRASARTVTATKRPLGSVGSG